MANAPQFLSCGFDQNTIISSPTRASCRRFLNPKPNPNPDVIRSERRKEELYAFSEEELRPYFALPEVKNTPTPFAVCM